MIDKLARKSAGDLVEMATAALARRGFSAIAVEPLAPQMGVTKGSFYARFRSREALVWAVLERWLEQDTTDVLAGLEAIDDPRERLEAFLETGFARYSWGRVFAALCAAASEPEVAPVMDRVRDARLGFLQQALESLGLAEQEGRDRATLI